MRKKVLQQIIDRVGGQQVLANECGVSQQTVSWWLANGVPAKWVRPVLKIDTKYGGTTRPEKLRPDIFGELRA